MENETKQERLHKQFCKDVRYLVNWKWDDPYTITTTSGVVLFSDCTNKLFKMYLKHETEVQQ